MLAEIHAENSKVELLPWDHVTYLRTLFINQEQEVSKRIYLEELIGPGFSGGLLRSIPPATTLHCSPPLFRIIPCFPHSWTYIGINLPPIRELY
ncbi:hypothetical protein DPEC_G00316520 [Dallia pectoralis]|uniref:Uncharacterized protein n=1 Tax=Dallia pectoralis TaxID=75939 RepID=A0ACC2FCS8_DALPE|nr:hypothetical protein DPEC_G00316520 [Dallia pectoralis]